MNHTCNNSLARKGYVIDNVLDNTAFTYWNNVHSEGDKLPF